VNAEEIVRRARVWLLAAAITAVLVAVVLVYGAQTGQLGFDNDDRVLTPHVLEGWS
jgi:hypothetical protein